MTTKNKKLCYKSLRMSEWDEFYNEADKDWVIKICASVSNVCIILVLLGLIIITIRVTWVLLLWRLT